MAEQDPKKDSQQPQKFEDWFKNLVEKIRPGARRLWELRKKLLIVNGIVAAITIIYLYLIAKPYYESTVTILPEFGSKTTTLSGLTQLASLAGVRVGESAPAEIYQNLLTSETVLSTVIYANYQTKKFNKPVNLVQYFLDDDSSENNVRKNFLEVYNILSRQVIKSNVDRLTKILTVTVTMPEPKLSAELANRIIEALDQYVRTKRKTFAVEQRFYLEKRTAQVKDSLTIAEEKMKQFREQNRVVIQSPSLLLEQGRLMREVEILNTVYIELTKQLEIAKVDEIRETPVVNIKELAEDPIYKAGPKRVNNFITVMFFSIILSGLFYIFQPRLKHYFRLIRGEKLIANNPA
ncbi:MAG: hypothetical protein HXY50_06870 [Ignavibacteriaceae bacterium]|nr:hypothetical protein [Ignavibacteriaceae bacterium]